MSDGMSDKTETTPPVPSDAPTGAPTAGEKAPPPPEVGGPKEADPTRYGDWTVKGRCIDF